MPLSLNVGCLTTDTSFLTPYARIICPHGGSVNLYANKFLVRNMKGQPLIDGNDVYAITGCPFVANGKPSPCVKLKWLPSDLERQLNGIIQPVRVSTSTICLSGVDAPQGAALCLSEF